MSLLCLSIHIILQLYSIILVPVIITFLIYMGFKYSVLCYLIFCLWDKDKCENGGRRWMAFRNFIITSIANYFPVKVTKTSDLPPTQNYLFVSHPHGVISLSTIFAVCQLEQVFPTFKIFLCVHDFNVKMPIIREYFMSLGMVSVVEKSIKWILNRPRGGNAAIIIPGGVNEGFSVKTGVHSQVLSKRKGFCRVALQTGCPLVPIYNFNEVNMFNIYDETSSALVKLFTKCKTLLGYRLPTYSGFLPKKIQLPVVVGSPIYVEKIDSPTKEQIDELHEIYIGKLKQLFDREKSKYLENSNKTDIVIV